MHVRYLHPAKALESILIAFKALRLTNRKLKLEIEARLRYLF